MPDIGDPRSAAAAEKMTNIETVVMPVQVVVEVLGLGDRLLERRQLDILGRRRRRCVAAVQVLLEERLVGTIQELDEDVGDRLQVSAREDLLASF